MSYHKWHYNNVYLKSEHWKKLRQACFDRDGHKCLDCGTTENLRAHHVQYRDSPYQTKLCDVETLCDKCHERAHQIKRFNGEVVSIKQMPHCLKPVFASRPEWEKKQERKAVRKRKQKWDRQKLYFDTIRANGTQFRPRARY